MGYYQIHDEQVVKTDINNLWNFVSDPSNLKKLTPSKLGFRMMTSTHTEMTEGMIITYRITPLLNIGVKWVTEISHVKKQNYFNQISRDPASSIELKEVESNKGVKVDD